MGSSLLNIKKYVLVFCLFTIFLTNFLQAECESLVKVLALYHVEYSELRHLSKAKQKFWFLYKNDDRFYFFLRTKLKIKKFNDYNIQKIIYEY